MCKEKHPHFQLIIQNFLISRSLSHRDRVSLPVRDVMDATTVPSSPVCKSGLDFSIVSSSPCSSTQWSIISPLDPITVPPHLTMSCVLPLVITDICCRDSSHVIGNWYKAVTGGYTVEKPLVGKPFRKTQRVSSVWPKRLARSDPEAWLSLTQRVGSGWLKGLAQFDQSKLYHCTAFPVTT